MVLWRWLSGCTPDVAFSARHVRPNTNKNDTDSLCTTSGTKVLSTQNLWALGREGRNKRMEMAGCRNENCMQLFSFAHVWDLINVLNQAVGFEMLYQESKRKSSITTDSIQSSVGIVTCISRRRI